MDKNYSNDNYNLVYSDTIDKLQLHLLLRRYFDLPARLPEATTKLVWLKSKDQRRRPV